MKKIFKYASLAVAAFGLAACSVDNVFPKDESGTEPTEAPGIDITISDVKDSSFTVKIAPTDTAAYYSYLVDADEDLTDELDPAELYAVAYESVAQGTVKYADHKSVTFTIEADPNTTYTVYAVVGSPEGNVGTIAHKTITTSDVVAPFFLTDEEGGYIFESQGTMIALPLSEAVVWDSTKVPTATVWPGAYKILGEDQELGMVAQFYFVNYPGFSSSQPAQAVVVDNDQNAVIIDFGSMTSGSIFTVSIPDGMLVDYAGNKIKGFKSYLPSGGELISANKGFWTAVNNVVVWTDDAPAPFTAPEPKRYSDKEQWFDVKFANGVFGILDDEGWKTVIKRTEGNAVTTFTNDMAPGEHFNLTDSSVVVYPAGDFILYDEITITIPAESIMDIYGNVNATEITVGPMVLSDLYVEETELEFTWFNDEAEDAIELSFYAPGDWTVDTAGIAPFKTTDALSGSEGQQTITITVNDYASLSYDRTLIVSSGGKDVDIYVYKPQNLFAAAIAQGGADPEYYEGTWTMAAIDLKTGNDVTAEIEIVKHTADSFYVYGLFGMYNIPIVAEYVAEYGQLCHVVGEIEGYNGISTYWYDSRDNNLKTPGDIWFALTEQGNLVISYDGNFMNGIGLVNGNSILAVYGNWHSIGTPPNANPASACSKYSWTAPKKEVKQVLTKIPFKRN